MKYLVTLAVTSCLTISPLHAATEFEDAVPVDLVKIFLNAPLTGNVMIYTDMPDNFPDFDLPAGFTLLGSVDQGYSQRVVYETTTGVEEAGTQIFNTLVEQGWSDMTVEMPQQQTGFVTRNAPVVGLGLMLCHDEFGNMQVMSIEGQDRNTVSLVRSGFASVGMISMQNSMSCEQQLAMRQGRGPFMRPGMNSGVSQYIPRMEMPEASSTARAPVFSGIGSGGGSMNDWEVRGQLPIDWEIAAVYQHFADQITEQDWQLDSEWSGNLSAGGVWSKSPEEEVNLIGMLTIVGIAENNYELKFRILQPGRGSGGWFTNSGPLVIQDSVRERAN